MKKLILPLLLLVAFGMLAAVESDPSEVVGYVKYPCIAGLNYFALPMDQDYTLWSQVAADYPGMFDTAYNWNQTSQGWDSAIDLGFMWTGDFAVTEGSPVWANALTAGDVYSIGDLPAVNASYSFVAGLNTMMVPLNYSSLTMASQVAAAVGTFDTMYDWNQTSQGWDSAIDLGFMWTGDFPVTIGYPMWVNSMSATTWPVRATSEPVTGSRSK